MQDVPMEDIACIKVIRGPGGTLWGSNAMNRASTSSPRAHGISKADSSPFRWPVQYQSILPRLQKVLRIVERFRRSPVNRQAPKRPNLF
jgi:hypothetical protein